ncbi:MAG TPA: helix-turn-helix domain-containing protein [Solirubrobacterales bacterium]|nr:helix-turn-helix domain-containing protein [Solirubrobacterales bacterium]
MPIEASTLVSNTRKRHGLSQRSLALRAGTDQAAISRIERGEVSPTVETVERLLAAMGETLRIESERFEAHHDPVHLVAMRERTPAERLELAGSWNRLAGRLADAGRRARGA